MLTAYATLISIGIFLVWLPAMNMYLVKRLPKVDDSNYHTINCVVIGIGAVFIAIAIGVMIYGM